MAGTRNWSDAIERAKRHPVGQFSDTHGSTLKSLAEAGIAEKLSDGLYYLTDKGWGEDKPAEESKTEQPAKVEETEEAASPKQMAVGMDAEMREAFERAVTTSGYLYGTSDAVLARLVDAGIAYQEVDEDAHQLTDKGWDLGTVPDPVSSSGIKYRVFGNARWQIPVELVDPVPDIQAPGFPMVRPKSLTIDLTPNRAGVWCVSSVAVWGPKVKDGKVATKREYSTLFSDLLNEVTGAPEWLRDICQVWANRANGWGVTAPKEDFDTALNRLLIRENLGGTEWAIEQLRENAAAAQRVADASTEKNVDSRLLSMALRVAADELEKSLDKRAAELATREH